MVRGGLSYGGHVKFKVQNEKFKMIVVTSHFLLFTCYLVLDEGEDFIGL